MVSCQQNGINISLGYTVWRKGKRMMEKTLIEIIKAFFDWTFEMSTLMFRWRITTTKKWTHTEIDCHKVSKITPFAWDIWITPIKTLSSVIFTKLIDCSIENDTDVKSFAVRIEKKKKRDNQTIVWKTNENLMLHTLFCRRRRCWCYCCHSKSDYCYKER